MKVRSDILIDNIHLRLQSTLRLSLVIYQEDNHDPDDILIHVHAIDGIEHISWREGMYLRRVQAIEGQDWTSS